MRRGRFQCSVSNAVRSFLMKAYSVPNAVPGSKVIRPPAAQTYTLTLDRASQVYVANPPIKVVIDGSIRLSVDNGKTEQVKLAPGSHKIELAASFRSAKVDVDLQRDTLIRIGFSRLTGKLTTEVI